MIWAFDFAAVKQKIITAVTIPAKKKMLTRPNLSPKTPGTTRPKNELALRIAIKNDASSADIP